MPQLQRQIAYDRLLERLYLVDDAEIVKGAIDPPPPFGNAIHLLGVARFDPQSVAWPDPVVVGQRPPDPVVECV